MNSPREMMAARLEDQYEILQAENGEAGFRLLSSEYRRISLMLTDLNMPVCNGFELMEKVGKDKILSRIPIVVMTSDAVESVEKRCIELGAVEFLSKSSDSELVRSRIRNIIKMTEDSNLIDLIEIDELTGIYTKQAFMHYASQMLTDHPDEDFDLTIMDIMKFKLIDGMYGEKMGDAVLKYIAGFGSLYMDRGLWARYGGDQFVALTPSSGDRCHHALRDRCLEEFVLGAPVPGLVLKTGVYERVDRNIPVSHMCSRALLALESIKNNYAQNLAFYDGPVSQRELRKLNYTNWMRDALKNNEFELWYQVKVDPYTNRVVGAEALVRWRHNGELIMPPSEYLSVFEENGQIILIDEYIFRKVCQQQARWKALGRELFPVSVNLSRKSMSRADLAERYSRIINEYCIHPRYVPIEITETAAVDSLKIKPLADELSLAGFVLHMDDFGTGESSLNGLTLLNFDTIKIDKSLIDTIGDERGELALRYSMRMMKELGLKIVAEGVEEEEQREFLMKYDCDAIQGFLYSRPLPSEVFDSYVAEMQQRAAAKDSSHKEFMEYVKDIEFSVSAIETILEYIPGGFFIYRADEEEKFIAINKAMLKLMDCSTKEEFWQLTRGSFKHFVHPDDLDETENAIIRQIAVRDDSMDYVEYRVTDRSGRTKWLRDYGRLVNMEAYGPVFCVFVSEKPDC